MRRPEQTIQRAIVQHLKVRGAPGVFAFHVPLGGWRRPKEAAIFKGLGCVPGVPDLIIIKDGRTFALELKAEGGKLSPIQSETITTMRRAGAVVDVVWGLDAALTWLEEHNLLVGRAA